MHAAGILHKDVKPANILLDESADDGLPDSLPDSRAVRLADFGIAGPAAPDAALTGGLTQDSAWLHTADPDRDAPDAPDVGAGAGTLSYMAPEQWEGQPATRRSDVYALGGVLYTALTASPPYPYDTLPQLARAVAVEPPPRARDHLPDLPPAYDDVVAAAMAKDPNERIPSAADLAAALRSAAAGRRPRLPRRAKTARRRRRTLAISAAAAAVVAAAVIVIGVLTGLLSWSHPSTPRPATGSGSPLRRVVCARDLELRDGPHGTAIGILRHGAVVTVLRRNDTQRWAYVRTATDRYGWVLGSWIRATCPANAWTTAHGPPGWFAQSMQR